MKHRLTHLSKYMTSEINESISGKNTREEFDARQKWLKILKKLLV